MEQLYQRYYEGEPFITVPDAGPCCSAGKQFCDLKAESEGERVVVVSAIDNLVKGASGQAIQNMNIMCGFDERDGLDDAGPAPLKRRRE